MDLEELGSVGGFFALRTGTPGEGQLPLARLYAGGTAPLTARIDTVASRLGQGPGAPERRVAASIAHLGLAARLWSVALGAAALHGQLPDLDPELLHWDPDRSSPDDLRLTAGRTLPATADSLRETVQYGHLVPLADALRSEVRISPQLLWGNAGSALAGAVRALQAWAGRSGRPEVGERTSALAAELFAHPDLSGTVHGPAMRRRSCCLYYRAPGGGLCGDCVFDRPPGISAQRS
ncbi:(2Fe-2S)-binding protein [Streptomyces lunaelactis]|uniref:(2Fe-2S)-binding protein n=1 Tax=Streptomyces lunaelactis TaxID=1535768 RepID=UPI001584508A|nr:(2Fe-2S)-binding protein [Streptomyces lunaelactis]NUK57295.1 (2Fe-2S)-binding protein [Streptomyces lunaelactis]